MSCYYCGARCFCPPKVVEAIPVEVAKQKAVSHVKEYLGEWLPKNFSGIDYGPREDKRLSGIRVNTRSVGLLTKENFTDLLRWYRV